MVDPMTIPTIWARTSGVKSAVIDTPQSYTGAAYIFVEEATEGGQYQRFPSDDILAPEVAARPVFARARSASPVALTAVRQVRMRWPPFSA